MNAFANWLDNDLHFIVFILSITAVGALLGWVASRIKSEPPSSSSWGKEAGTPENRDDELAINEATKADDFQVWEAECAKLQRLADKLGTRSTP